MLPAEAAADGEDAAAPDAKRAKTELAAETPATAEPATAAAGDEAGGDAQEAGVATAKQPAEAVAAAVPAAVEDGCGGKAAAAADTEQPADAAAAANEAEAGGADEEAHEADAAQEVEREPVTLGFRMFANGEECYQYFHDLLVTLTKDQDLNPVSASRIFPTLPFWFWGSLPYHPAANVYRAPRPRCFAVL